MDGQGDAFRRESSPKLIGCQSKRENRRWKFNSLFPEALLPTPSELSLPLVPIPGPDPTARVWSVRTQLCYPKAWKVLRGRSGAGSPRTGRNSSGSQSPALENGYSHPREPSRLGTESAPVSEHPASSPPGWGVLSGLAAPPPPAPPLPALHPAPPDPGSARASAAPTSFPQRRPGRESVTPPRGLRAELPEARADYVPAPVALLVREILLWPPI